MSRNAPIRTFNRLECRQLASSKGKKVKVAKVLINWRTGALQVGQNADANTNCRSCGKVVFQMEQTKAEGLVWHKNCFRCVQCSKQLNVDNYESHESTLYCKPHFKELFQPKPVEESDQPGKMITIPCDTARIRVYRRITVA